MTPKERRSLDFLPILEKISAEGAAHIPGFIDRKTVTALGKALNDEINYYRYYQEHASGVVENYFKPEPLPPESASMVVALGERIEDELAKHSGSFTGLLNWSPNDYAVHMYGKGSYITSHLDRKDCNGVIVTATIQGEADIALRYTRKEEPYAIFRVKPGDLVILRATGFNSAVKGHPGVFHSVSGSLGPSPRISVGFRDIRQNLTKMNA